jgi:hypothetical protein
MNKGVAIEARTTTARGVVVRGTRAKGGGSVHVERRTRIIGAKVDFAWK